MYVLLDTQVLRRFWYYGHMELNFIQSPDAEEDPVGRQWGRFLVQVCGCVLWTARETPEQT